jgi:putative hydrolase of the HAD superfamily
MLKNKITDIFFDLDHTLWDFDTNSALAFEKLLEKHHIPVNINRFLAIYEPVNQQYWDKYSKGLKTKNEVKYNRLIDTFELLNIDVDFDFIKVLANEYLDFLKQENTLMEGTIELLDYLKNKYRLHILTNGFKEVQTDKMKNSGIASYFDFVITSEEAGKLKPHPDVFNHALKKVNTFAHKSYMIGDNFKSDILGAKNVGMNVIHFDPFEQNDVDFKIIPKVKKLIEIKEIL